MPALAPKRLTSPSPPPFPPAGDELHPGAISNSIRYTGQRFDAESGLMYYKNRYNDPAAGRFIGRDPLGWRAGANLYGYVGGQPTMAVDPEGLAKVWWNPTTWGDTNGAPWYTREAWTTGGPEQGQAFLAGVKDGLVAVDDVLDSGIDLGFDLVIWGGQFVGLSPEEWGSQRGDYFYCVARCLEESMRPGALMTSVTWLSAGGPHPKFRSLVSKKQRWLTSIPRRISLIWQSGWARGWADGLKGRGPASVMRPVSRVAGAALLLEGAWALGVETNCLAECAGNPCSY